MGFYRTLSSTKEEKMLTGEQNYIRHVDLLIDPQSGEVVTDVDFPFDKTFIIHWVCLSS